MRKWIKSLFYVQWGNILNKLNKKYFVLTRFLNLPSRDGRPWIVRFNYWKKLFFLNLPTDFDISNIADCLTNGHELSYLISSYFEHIRQTDQRTQLFIRGASMTQLRNYFTHSPSKENTVRIVDRITILSLMCQLTRCNEEIWQRNERWMLFGLFIRFVCVIPFHSRRSYPTYNY